MTPNHLGILSWNNKVLSNGLIPDSGGCDKEASVLEKNVGVISQAIGWTVKKSSKFTDSILVNFHSENKERISSQAAW